MTLRLDALGVSVALSFGGSRRGELAALAATAWDWCLVEPGDVAASVSLRVVLDDDESVVAAAREAGDLAGSDAAHVMDALSPKVTISAIEQRAGQLFMLHACGLADPASGRAVALVAPSGTGKTTATRALGPTFGYLSDETVAVDSDGRVVPYPKPLSIKVDGSRYKQQVALADLGWSRPPMTSILHRVLMLDRDGSAEPWLEPVSTVRALALLAPETSFLARLPQPLHHVARILDSRGGLRVLHYAEADTLPPVIAAILGES